MTAYNEAIAQSPDYSRAFFARGEALGRLGKFEAAAADFEAAMALDDTPDAVLGDLAYLRLGMGDFAGAIDLNRQALEATPDQLWIRFDLAISLLADNHINAALVEYDRGMVQAAEMVRTADERGEIPAYSLWWSLDGAIDDLELMISVIDGDLNLPLSEKLADPPAIRQAAEDMVARLKSLILTLEYNRRPPQGELTASVGPLTFAESTGSPPLDQFPADTDGILVLFDYQGIQAGERVIVKVNVNGEEDPSLRTITMWTEEPSGTAALPIGMGVMNLPAFVPGGYAVEVYVGDHLAQTGQFEVLEK